MFRTINEKLSNCMVNLHDCDFIGSAILLVEITDVVILLTWRDEQNYKLINLICCGIIFMHEGYKILNFQRGMVRAINNHETHLLIVLTEMVGVLTGYANPQAKLHVLRFCGILKLSNVCVWISRTWKLLQNRLKQKLKGDSKREIDHGYVYEGHKEFEVTIASLFHVLLALSKIFLQFFCSLLILIYIFMILGMELFNGGGKPDRCSVTDQMENHPNALFCNSLTTALVLFQIMATNDWHSIMYATIEVYDDWAAIYFVVFFFLGPMIMICLLIAFVWDFYFEEFKKVQDSKYFPGDDEILPKRAESNNGFEPQNEAELAAESSNKEWKQKYGKYKVETSGGIAAMR